MDMVRTLLSLVLGMTLAATGLRAETLSLTIGNPIASQGAVKKIGTAFIFRVNGCADMSKAKITATAEGLIDGARKSIPLSASATTPAGVYAINQQWDSQGKWVVAITTTC